MRACIESRARTKVFASSSQGSSVNSVCTENEAAATANKTHINSQTHTLTSTTGREMNVKNAWGTHKEYTFKQRSHQLKCTARTNPHEQRTKKAKGISVRNGAELRHTHGSVSLFAVFHFLAAIGSDSILVLSASSLVFCLLLLIQQRTI